MIHRVEPHPSDRNGRAGRGAPLTRSRLPVPRHLAGWLAGVLLWVASPALADGPTCAPVSQLPQPALSMAWVSPAGQRVGLGGKVAVVPTAALRRWLDEEHADVARLLQGLGLRKRSKPPKRRWKITIFDVDAALLCRPMADAEAGDPVGGHPACKQGKRAVPGKYDGCGYLTDRRSGQRTFDTFLVPWKDAAANGFCVLPAERFIRGE